MNKPPSSEKTDLAKIYLLPNLMTAGNLLCGFSAVLWIFEGALQRQSGALPEIWMKSYTYSLYLIFAAFVFDMLDGRLARFGGGQGSAFGREFDSLADLVSFGVAPALLVFKIILSEFGRVAYIVAGFYLLCGALRLARFNVISALHPIRSSHHFTGFPIPAAAGFIASLTLFLLPFYESERAFELGNAKYALVGLMIFLSFMMFSQFKYPSFRTIGWRSQHTIPKFLFIVVLLIITIHYYHIMLAVLFLTYLLYGFFRSFISRALRQEIEDNGSKGTST